VHKTAFIEFPILIPILEANFRSACKEETFMVPPSAPGLRLICRQSYEMAAAHLGGFVDQCLREYAMNGWRIPGLVNPDDVNVFVACRRRR